MVWKVRQLFEGTTTTTTHTESPIHKNDWRRALADCTKAMYQVSEARGGDGRRWRKAGVWRGEGMGGYTGWQGGERERMHAAPGRVGSSTSTHNYILILLTFLLTHDLQ